MIRSERELLHLRLSNQCLNDSKFTSVVDLVSHLGAVQAQDFAMSKWAIGMRLPEATDAEVQQHLDEGRLVRTHVLRPTWHIVTVNDIRWMLDLSAPRINQKLVAMYRQQELTDVIFRKTNKIIEKALADGAELTREELMMILQKKGIKAQGDRAAHIMFRAELDKIVCNGKRRGSQNTYALFDKKIPPAKPLLQEEAMARLAKLYFISRGPATETDFAWWSGLTLTECRAAIRSVQNDLHKFDLNGKQYWVSSDTVALPRKSKINLLLLPAFDEFLISYADRSAATRLDTKTKPGAQIFHPVTLENGLVTGNWSRTFKKGSVHIEIKNCLKKIAPLATKTAAKRFGNFLRMPALETHFK